MSEGGQYGRNMQHVLTEPTKFVVVDGLRSSVFFLNGKLRSPNLRYGCMEGQM
jgi:hypothetical protein